MKQTIRYDFGVARLELEGLPDISLGQNDNEIGIILSWKLNIIGFPQLEGKKEHLDTFIGLISQYSRNYISGVIKPLGSSESLISINFDQRKHLLCLKSTQSGVKPLEISLDDAELVDLTKCFDLLRSDSKIKIKWLFPGEKPLRRRDLNLNKKAFTSLFFPFCGLFVLSLSSLLLLNIPTENIQEIKIENKLQE